MAAFKTLKAAPSIFIEISNNRKHTTPLLLGASTSNF